MKKNRLHHLMGATILVCLLSQVSASSSYNVYFTDPQTGCIYGKPATATSQQPYLVSGNATLSASHIYFIDENQIVFSNLAAPDQIIYTNTSTHETEQLDVVPENQTVRTLAGSLSANSFLFISGTDFQSTLHTAAYNSTTQSWDVTAKFSWTSIPLKYEVKAIQISPEKFVVSEHNDSSDVIYLFDASQPSPTPELILDTDSYENCLTVGPDSNWSYSHQNDLFQQETFFFDSDGNPITPAEAQATILNENLTQLYWDDQDPQLLASTTRNLLAQSSSEYTSPPVELYASLDASGNIVPEKDLGGFSFLKPFVQGNVWVGYDEINGLPVEMNTSTDIKKIKFTYGKGNGPYMGDLLSMDSGSDGNLYVLSTLYGSQSIYLVEPETGDRTLICEKLPYAFSPFIQVQENGNLLLTKRTCTTQLDNTSLCGLSIFEVIPTQDPTGFQCTQIAFEESDSHLYDVTLGTEGELKVLYNQRGGKFLSQLEGATLSTELTQIPSTGFSLEQGMAFPTIDNPAQITVPTGIENSTFFKLEMSFRIENNDGSGHIGYSLTDPSNTIYTGQSFCDRDLLDENKYTATFTIKATQAPTAGVWSLYIFEPNDRGLEFNETTNIELKFFQTPHARQMAFTSPTTLVTYNAISPSLTTLNTDTGTFETIPIIDATEELAYPADFQRAPDGTLFLSTQAECNIYKITPQGETTPFAVRPRTFPSEVLAETNGLNNPTITFGPEVSLGQTSTVGRVWWLFQ
jgi:hypothetical protein